MTKNDWAVAAGPDSGEPMDALRIWEGVPLRNPTFTGREALLSTLLRALDRRSKASVLPHALHGLGGVGKTQLAVEFAYRYAERYDIVWWIPAEHRTLVLQSLRDLGRRLGTPEAASLQQSATHVLDRLRELPRRWLLIYDNANDPEDLLKLIPSVGGHVILTSRNQTWSGLWDPVEVDVFDRSESIELIRKRGLDVSPPDAERLAARLDDLPLALDQAAACQAASGMPVDDYLTRLDGHLRVVSPGEPLTGPTTVTAVVRLTLELLRANAPAAGELLEMFAFLGAEPISRGLLHRGRDAQVSPLLGAALRNPSGLNRAILDLNRYGIASVDANRRFQVHRLFQLVLRDQLSGEGLTRSRANVHRVLASANPGFPDDEANWPVHGEIGPHVEPAGLVESELIDARRVVADQAQYLQEIGDSEGSRRLAESAEKSWSKAQGAAGLGPDGELTLRVGLALAISLRFLGFNERSRELAEDVYRRVQRSPDFGPDDELTLYAASTVAVGLRVAGLFRDALDLDRDVVARSRRMYGAEDPQTLIARGNLAVNLRMLSDLPGAFDIDDAVMHDWQQTVSENDNRLLFAQTNLARDLYGLGRYGDALALQRRILPRFREQRGARHPHVLLAGRTLAFTLRKVGRYEEALVAAEEHHRDSIDRYGPDHEHSLAAAMTLANSQRVVGDLAAADQFASDAVARYRHLFGEDHPLTLVAAINYAIVLRGRGEHPRAKRLDSDSHARMKKRLGHRHGYTLCALNGLAIDMAMAGERSAARELTTEALAISQEARGDRHPYTLACALNAGLAASEDGNAIPPLLNRAVENFTEVLGADHPETFAASEGQWAECDIEPPPT